jgi:HlyD family secretion protein
MNTRRIIIIAAVVVVIVAAIFGFRALSAGQRQARLTEDLQIETIQVGSLEALVGATGTVRANQTVHLNWQTSGTVNAVFAGIGDQVEAGEVLADLEQTSLPQNVILAQADLVNAQNALEDLLDSYEGLSLALAEKQVADARLRYDNAREYVDDINYVGPQDEIDKAYRNLQKAYDELQRAEAEKNSIGNTNSTAYKIAYFQYREAYNNYATKLGDYNYLTGQTVDEIERSIAEADLAVAEQRLADAEAELARLQSGPDPDDVAAAEARVAAAEAALDAARIISPFDGTVTLADAKAGDQAQPGAPAFRVDDLSSLLVDVEVSEVDINRVQVGQPVVLTFDAILATEYQGEVAEVSPVGNTVQGLVNFRVTIQVQDPDKNVRPGMTAAVNIIVDRLENVLLVPNRAVRVVDGQRVVYVLKGGELEMVEIFLGASADLFSEVISGELSRGDEVVLNPPTEFMTMGGPPPFGN